ncbi:MAG: hypothetical protein ACREC4_00310 [Methylocella sp.]
MRMPAANYRSMIENRILEVWPDIGSTTPIDGERYVVSLGFGRFAVIEGRKLNDAPLTKEQAAALAQNYT